MAPAAEKVGGIKKFDFQDFQILLSTVSWGGWGVPWEISAISSLIPLIY